MQLFVIPAVIVVIIVVLWLLFNWIAQGSSDPVAEIQELSRNRETRWQTAVNLADSIHRNETFRRSHKGAAQLASLFEKQLTEGSMEAEAIQYRTYLCAALGKFEVEEVVPALVKAATTQRDDKEKEVRVAAVQALAVLVDGFVHRKPDPLPAPEGVETALLDLSKDADDIVRNSAIYGLGVLGSDAAKQRLRSALEDSFADVRYNAATGLARQGDATAEPVLLEMLQLPRDRSLPADVSRELGEQQRQSIIVNALRSLEQFATINPQGISSELQKAVQSLAEVAGGGAIPTQAKATASQFSTLAPHNK
jgi:HEAT repeat protein